MTAENSSLKTRATKALNDDSLQQALSVIGTGFVQKRAKAVAACPDFQALSDRGVEIKEHALTHLDHYLTEFETALKATGGHLHFANTPQEARKIISDICHQQNAKLVAKGKTMVGEEIDLTHHLTDQGFECVETDLGEYLIQLRDEMPSHIIAPAVHLSRDTIAQDFKEAHTSLAQDRLLEKPEDLVKEARVIMREKFLKADVGITGANLLIAETGTSVIVTNEGNGDLVSSLPKTHIVISSFDKVVPTFEDASVILRLLARSATGQAISTYTTFTTGPKRATDQDGPSNFHVVLLDNGRSKMLGSQFQEMLRCIRCGACLNHCPVYQNLGGHAYGSVYPGPMGTVLSPQFMGKQSQDLPFASSFCGRCNEICPMQIPLTKLMRFWRQEAAKDHGWLEKISMKGWAALAKRPWLYNAMLKLSLPVLAWTTKQKALTKHIPMLKAWGQHRTVPALAPQSFQSLYKASQNKKKQSQ